MTGFQNNQPRTCVSDRLKCSSHSLNMPCLLPRFGYNFYQKLRTYILATSDVLTADLGHSYILREPVRRFSRFVLLRSHDDWLADSMGIVIADEMRPGNLRPCHRLSEHVAEEPGCHVSLAARNHQFRCAASRVIRTGDGYRSQRETSGKRSLRKLLKRS